MKHTKSTLPTVKIFSFFLVKTVLYSLLILSMSSGVVALSDRNDDEAELFDQLYNDEDDTYTTDSENRSELDTLDDQSLKTANPYEGKIIHLVSVVGNNSVSAQSILNHVPYKEGAPYFSKPCIKNIHAMLKQIRYVEIDVVPFGMTMVDIIIKVEEKASIGQILIEGNYNLKSKDIFKAIDAEHITSLDVQELNVLALKIKALYKEKGYYGAIVKTELRFNEANNEAIAVFSVEEGVRSAVKKILFEGNKSISSKELRALLLTKEEWLLSFLDKTGSYHEDRAKYGDVHVIEQLYQNKGFLRAKVVDILPDIDQSTGGMTLTYIIQEGSRFTFSDITVDATEEFDTDRLLLLTNIRSGDLYSKEAIVQAIKRFESLWAHQGYIFSHIDPIIIPNEKEQTVSVHFGFEKGKKMILNRIKIKGNKKTKDKVIRRKLLLREGELITQRLLNHSKQNVQALGYFDQKDGVNLQIKRLNDDEADIDLVVKEGKSGHFAFNLGYGGNGKDMSSPLSGLTAKVDFSDNNLLGSGINTSLAASWALEEQTIIFHLAQPWLFDKPILGALDVYHKRPSYDELRHLENGPVNEKLTGGALTNGYALHSHSGLFNDTQLFASVGIDSVRYQKQPKARSFGSDIIGALQTAQFQSLLDKSFTPGDYVWLSYNMEQDMRNHPMFPKEGHRWRFTAKAGIPTFNNAIGFYKVTFDTHWYTTLIQEYDLVLHTHAFFGLATPVNRQRTVPFSELFHIGGPATVRGFRFGEVGPKFLNESGIGAKKAMFVNVELLFPITSDYSMRGVLFYDGGAGWDNPYVHGADKAFVTGNSFDYRHSVGIGIRLTSPVPVKVDWGFKIDPRKDRLDRSRDENASEVHFSMSYDW
ncbi:MAG TPA: outer membrane protein assembly factor BamA [Patescibacteria group bacterium]|jgi:outer membrane protein insertion porin family|nr:outer membrane protein assembly factor BamA [Patescibacteria group bacterium]